MINNYKITIEYLGKGFVGWQIQKNGKSIQAIIESALSQVLKKKLEVKRIKKAIKYFKGTHDFSAFRSSSCSAKNPIRKISMISVKKKKDKIIFLIESKSFLQKQVRSMVGCLKYVGESKWKPERVKEVIDSKKRENCAPPAPPEGLYLKKIFY